MTVGCSQALYVSILCLVKPGDEVILFEPFFDLYIGQIRMAGGTPRYVPLRSQDGSWELDFDCLESTLNGRSRVLILNSPHNPTGKVFSAAEMLRIADIVRRFPMLTVVSDEVYKYTVHGSEAGHVHFASLPGMFDQTLTLSSAGKTFSGMFHLRPHLHAASFPRAAAPSFAPASSLFGTVVTGWQVGWIVGPERILHDIHIALPFLQFCASTPMQQALVGVLEEAEKPYRGSANYYDWLCAQYRRKAAMLSKSLARAGLPVVESEGGYFLTVDVSGVDVPAR